MLNYIYLIAIVLVASFVQSTVGFGFAVLSVAFLPLVFPYVKALSYVQAIAITSTLYLAVKLRRSTRWKVLLPMLIPALIIGSITTWFSLKANSDVLFILLGIMLVALSIYSLVFTSKVKLKPTVLNGTIMGMCTGLSNGLFAIGGPTSAMYLIPATDSKEEYLACIQTLFVFTNAINIGVRISRGAYVVEDIPLILTGWVAMFIGTLLGQVAFRKIDAKIFNKIVYAVVGLNGLWILLSHIF